MPRVTICYSITYITVATSSCHIINYKTKDKVNKPTILWTNDLKSEITITNCFCNIFYYTKNLNFILYCAVLAQKKWDKDDGIQYGGGFAGPETSNEKLL